MKSVKPEVRQCASTESIICELRPLSAKCPQYEFYQERLCRCPVEAALCVDPGHHWTESLLQTSNLSNHKTVYTHAHNKEHTHTHRGFALVCSSDKKARTVRPSKTNPHEKNKVRNGTEYTIEDIPEGK